MANEFRYPKRSLTRRLFFGVIIERFQGNGGGLCRLRPRQRNATPNTLPVIHRFAPSVGVKRCHTRSLRHQGASRWDASLTPAPGMAMRTPRRGETTDDGAETAERDVGYVLSRCACGAMHPPLPPRGNARKLTRESRAGTPRENDALERYLCYDYK